MCTLRLVSSTTVFGQTRWISSSLLTRSPARSTRAAKISNARDPTRTGLPDSSSNCSAGRRRNGPNVICGAEMLVANDIPDASYDEPRPILRLSAGAHR